MGRAEDLGTEFAKMCSIDQAEFLVAAVEESLTWDVPGSSQWVYIGEQLAKEPEYCNRAVEMLQTILDGHILYLYRKSHPTTPEPEPSLEPEPESDLDVMDFLEDL